MEEEEEDCRPCGGDTTLAPFVGSSSRDVRRQQEVCSTSSLVALSVGLESEHVS